MKAYMATFPGREQAALKAINSLAPQVDSLQVYCNGYSAMMAVKLLAQLPPNVYLERGEDLGDVGKFFGCEEWRGEVMTVDDDILYPPDYVAALASGLKAHSGVVSYHGRIVTLPISSFFHSKDKYYPFYGNTPTVEVNLIGTGCMALNVDDLHEQLALDWFEYTNIADIYFSIEMQRQGVKLRVLEHKPGWIKQQTVGVTIADAQAQDDYLETSLVNKYLHDVG
jgi:hypothetical protein